jgi:hypothetical protein
MLVDDMIKASFKFIKNILDFIFVGIFTLGIIYYIYRFLNLFIKFKDEIYGLTISVWICWLTYITLWIIYKVSIYRRKFKNEQND